ncbi:MAG: protein translocase subunit SecD [Oscillospiraceae bacterium]|nr:protein translocase subunit SecD [Oscillospiraceae bacterium]
MKKSVLLFIAVLVAVGLLALVAVNGVDLLAFEIPSYKDGIVLGLDLSGGSSITYEAQIPEGMSQSEVDRGMIAAEAMLRARLTSFGYTEAMLSRAGGNRIRVEIPKITNPEEAVKMLGSTARLEFRDPDGNVIIYGSDVTKAEVNVGPVDEYGPSVPYVSMELSADAREVFRLATMEAAGRPDGDNYIAIYLDEELQSAPTVEARHAAAGIDPVDGVMITVAGNREEARRLASLISIGQMPFDLRQVELRSVGAVLGERALETSLMAGAIGLVLVLVFMLVFYRLPGLVANLALISYTVLMVLLLSILRVNLSLPGIAGIILSIGMAVDANVIIFERIKDEIRLGKTIRAAISSGYRRALTAIIDSNITTIISAVVLLALGTGPIKGFAITLLIGVLLSMFTVLVISRFLLDCMVNMKVTNSRMYGV